MGAPHARLKKSINVYLLQYNLLVSCPENVLNYGNIKKKTIGCGNAVFQEYNRCICKIRCVLRYIFSMYLIDMSVKKYNALLKVL